MREKWIDIARGILIILVVFGHSAFIQYYSNWHSIIYWFHMPSFFFLSGYVFKPKENYGQQAKRITMRLLLPYAIILIAITCYRYMFTPMSPDVWRELLHDLIRWSLHRRILCTVLVYYMPMVHSIGIRSVDQTSEGLFCGVSLSLCLQSHTFNLFRGKFLETLI